MLRKNVLKILLLSSFIPEFLFTGRNGRGFLRKIWNRLSEGRSVPAFESKWHHWPDMKWTGPCFWGNRLQDWQIKKGKAECVASGPNRTLHCLTSGLTDSPGSFETGVTFNLLNRSASEENYIGFRLGAKGPFDDYRSAAVFGEGLDAGIMTDGRLFIGEKISSRTVSLEGEHRLVLKAGPDSSNGYNIFLSIRDKTGNQPLATLEAENIPAPKLNGNIALVSHYTPEDDDAAPGSSAQFSRFKIKGAGTADYPDRAFGPICFAQYTLHRNCLKLTAQLSPVETVPGSKVSLQIKADHTWKTLQESSIEKMGRTAHFRMENWAFSEAVPYRIRLELPLKNGVNQYYYGGTIASDPVEAEQLKAAVFSCNCDYGFPDSEVTRHVARHTPDMALFLGDQFYESTGGFGIQTSPLEKAVLDYLHKWYMFGWSYRDIFRHIPSAVIPDDHDVYHGNVWGEGGKKAPTDRGWGSVAQDQGGYKMPPRWVNVVQRTQTGHLPDPYDPAPVRQGIGVYYTSWNYGGISFAIIEDRKFKTAPKNVLPEEADVVNGFIRNPDFDIRKYRDTDADLLGERQLSFLKEWSADWGDGVEMKAVLSQTNFSTVATLPEESLTDEVVPELRIPEPDEYIKGDAPTVDMDSNGWPQKGRDRALSIMRKCFAFHIAGDQHLASMVHYGIDEFGDSGYGFAGPALNNIWPRRWWPPVEKHEPLPGKPRYTGDFLDGFGNKMTVHAVANPRKTGVKPAIIHDRSTGYGIVTFDKSDRTIHTECWPRYVDPEKNPRAQYEGWPVTVSQLDNYGREPAGYLPEIRVEGIKDPVVEIFRQHTGEMIYAIRIKGRVFKPKIFEDDLYSLRIGDPGKDIWREYQNVKISKSEDRSINCSF